MTLEELSDNFELLEDWEDKYRYIIDLGSKLPIFEEKLRTEEWKVQGCSSQVWLVPTVQENKLFFQGDSDAAIVKGLLSIVLMIFSGKTSQEIEKINGETIFTSLGLQENLSPSRRNGLFSMIEKIKYYAKNLKG
ncbi:MAG: SufE family protein [Alphaproteobacteria bacterium]|nr:SufE family protein [Alphaproteobacteria bacterium]